MIPLEDEVLQLSGLEKEEYQAEFTMFTMAGVPFKVRTIYIHREDKHKPSLLLTHGNMSMAIGYFRMFKTLSKYFRIVAFDNMNLGLKTKSSETRHANNSERSPEQAESWIMEWLGNAIGRMDLPEKFYMAGVSFGGYLCMLYASMHPERIESMFLLNPLGISSYDRKSYMSYSGVPLIDDERCETTKCTDANLKRIIQGKTGSDIMHRQKLHMKKIVLTLIIGGVKNAMHKGKHPDELINVFTKYYWHMLVRPGAADITMEGPFQWFAHTIHSMHEPDRLNNPACNFPLAIAFGGRGEFASSEGAENLLNMIKNYNEGRINLFKLERDTTAIGESHNLQGDFPDEAVAIMLKHFDGTIQGRWEPTKLASRTTKLRPSARVAPENLFVN